MILILNLSVNISSLSLKELVYFVISYKPQKKHLLISSYYAIIIEQLPSLPFTFPVFGPSSIFDGYFFAHTQKQQLRRYPKLLF